MLNYFTADTFGNSSDLLVKTKFSFGILASPVQTYRWRKFLSRYRILSSLAQDLLYLKSRIYRPYFSASLGCTARTAKLMTHYRLAMEAGLGGLLRKSAFQPVPVAEMTGRSGMRYQLFLTALDEMRPEGEMVLKLKCSLHTVYTAAFNFAEEKGVRMLELGGLYGLLPVDKTMCIKSVTRDLYGCKPRAIMVDALRHIASTLRCQRVILVSNRHKLVTAERVCRKSYDYDKTWAEVGAVQRTDGNFEIVALSLYGHDNKAGDMSSCMRQKELFVRDMAAQLQAFFLAEASTARNAL